MQHLLSRISNIWLNISLALPAVKMPCCAHWAIMGMRPLLAQIHFSSNWAKKRTKKKQSFQTLQKHFWLIEQISHMAKINTWRTLYWTYLYPEYTAVSRSASRRACVFVCVLRDGRCFFFFNISKDSYCCLNLHLRPPLVLLISNILSLWFWFSNGVYN